MIRAAAEAHSWSLWPVRCEHTSNSLADVSEGLTSRMPRIGGSSSHRQTVSSARAAALEADEADEADEGG